MTHLKDMANFFNLHMLLLLIILSFEFSQLIEGRCWNAGLNFNSQSANWFSNLSEIRAVSNCDKPPPDNTIVALLRLNSSSTYLHTPFIIRLIGSIDRSFHLHVLLVDTIDREIILDGHSFVTSRPHVFDTESFKIKVFHQQNDVKIVGMKVHDWPPVSNYFNSSVYTEALLIDLDISRINSSDLILRPLNESESLCSFLTVKSALPACSYDTCYEDNGPVSTQSRYMVHPKEYWLVILLLENVTCPEVLLSIQSSSEFSAIPVLVIASHLKTSLRIDSLNLRRSVHLELQNTIAWNKSTESHPGIIIGQHDMNPDRVLESIRANYSLDDSSKFIHIVEVIRVNRLPSHNSPIFAINVDFSKHPRSVSTAVEEVAVAECSRNWVYVKVPLPLPHFSTLSNYELHVGHLGCTMRLNYGRQYLERNISLINPVNLKCGVNLIMSGNITILITAGKHLNKANIFCKSKLRYPEIQLRKYRDLSKSPVILFQPFSPYWINILHIRGKSFVVMNCSIQEIYKHKKEIIPIIDNNTVLNLGSDSNYQITHYHDNSLNEDYSLFLYVRNIKAINISFQCAVLNQTRIIPTLTCDENGDYNLSSIQLFNSIIGLTSQHFPVINCQEESTMSSTFSLSGTVMISLVFFIVGGLVGHLFCLLMKPRFKSQQRRSYLRQVNESSRFEAISCADTNSNSLLVTYNNSSSQQPVNRD